MTHKPKSKKNGSHEASQRKGYLFGFSRSAQRQDDTIDDRGNAGTKGAEEKADRDGFVEGTVTVGDAAHGGDDVGQDSLDEGLEAADGDIFPIDIVHSC